jgi:hypothetical protein
MVAMCPQAVVTNDELCFEAPVAGVTFQRCRETILESSGCIHTV